MVEGVGGFAVDSYLTFLMTCLQSLSRWVRVSVAGVGGLQLEPESGCRDCAASSARDGEKTAWEGGGGGGQREKREGGELKGTEAGLGELFRRTPTRLSSSHPSIQAPSLGSLGVVMETGRQARPGKVGGTKEGKERERISRACPSDQL